MLYNFNSIKSIELLQQNGFFALFMLEFPNYTRYVITFMRKPYLKYSSFKWAFKKYCSLIGVSYEKTKES